MRSASTAKALAGLLALSLLAAACSDDGDDPGSGSEAASDDAALVDVATFAAGPPTNLDPALNGDADAYSVVNQLYDGLTDLDTSDPDDPVVVPLVAESFDSPDSKVWTFTIREGVEFSDGEAVQASSFVRGWERAAALGGPYSNLFELIEGGAAKVNGEAPTITGVVADDAARTLTVTLTQPLADFPILAGFQVFSPMPSAVDELDDQSQWDQGVMIGNGPFKMAEARTDSEVVLERNERWAGNFQGIDQASLDRITFRVSEDRDSAFASFEADEAHVGPLPRDGAQAVAEQYGDTLDTSLLSSYHLQIAWNDPVLGGPDNVELRRAISLAIDRDEVNEAAYGGTQANATGIVPPGIPGFEADLCDHCRHDPDAAKEAFAKWTEAGNELDGPVVLQVNAGQGHEPALQVMVDNLKAVGIDARADTPPQEAYQELLGTGGCTICRFNWVADYPTYDNFLKSMFHSSGGEPHPPNFGSYVNPEFDQLVDQAIGTTDTEERAELFRRAEDLLVNVDVGVIPVFWGRGLYIYDEDEVEDFEQTPFGIVLWEQVRLAD